MKIFWAWQSDLPGKISRHFVRDALEAAIEKLKQVPDIEEPSEESRRNQLHLDSDRQGLPGSPDLARAILNKIDVSSVFVGDVTPVGKGAPTVADNGVKREGKPLMNPNVAIELGYALSKLGDQKLLMILNTAYGNRDGLPFDIRHKAGPVLYELADGATSRQIELERAKLTDKLFDAFHTFKSAEESTTSTSFNENLPKIGKALFFEDGEILASSKENSIKHKMSSRSVFYLRVIPQELDMPLAIGKLRQYAANFGAFSYDEEYHKHEDGYGYIRENDHGVLVFNHFGDIGTIGSLTQYFRNGEIWGINAEILYEGEDEIEKYVPSRQVEHTIAESLELYLTFQRDVSGTSPPYIVEAGLHGIKGRILTNPGSIFNKYAKFSPDSFELRHVLNSTDLATQDKYLLKFFELMHKQTGYPRPPKLYGFPPDRSAAST